jgi:sugar phosphate permease
MKKHYAWVIAFTGTLVLLISHGFGRMSYSIILPSMREALGLTYTQIGLIGTGNFVGYLGLSIIGGFLASRYGTRKIIFISLIVMGISLFLTGFSNSFAAAFFMRLITGMGNGGSYIPMMALPAAWFAVKKRGLASGINTIGTGLGLSITGLILPMFIARYGHEGWRYAWYLMGTLAFAGSFVCYFFLRDNPGEKGLSMYGGDDNHQAEKQIPQKFTFITAWSDVAGETEVWKLGCVYFMYGFSYIIYLTFFIAFLIKEMGFSTESSGSIFAIIGFMCIFSGVVWGSISDIIGRRCGSLLAYIILTLSYLLPVFWQNNLSIYLSAMLFGITMSALPVIMAAAAGDAVGGRLAPAGLGFITVFFGMGQALGPALAGWVKDTTGTFSFAFLASAAISLVGAILSLMLRKKGRQN